MLMIKSGTNKSTQWLKITIVLAVALLSSCLLLSVIVGDTFQQEVSRTLEDMPADSFEIDLKHTEVTSLTPAIQLLPQSVSGISTIARATRTIYISRITGSKDGQKYTVAEDLLFKGVEPEFFSIRHLPLAAGRLFDRADQDNVAVIGTGLAAAGGYKLGSTIRRLYIEQQYRVIGILQSNDACPETWFAFSPLDWQVNDMMFTPIEATPRLTPPHEIYKRGYEDLMKDTETWVQVWIGSEVGEDINALMENAQTYLKALPGTTVFGSGITPRTQITHEYVAEKTSSSLENMGIVVVAVGVLSISGLMLMHIVLGVKVIGIKRTLGATQKRLMWENYGTYAVLSLCGFLLSLIIIQPLVPMVSNFLGVELQVLPRTLLTTMLGVTILAPLCSLIPTVAASKVSPLDATRDRLGWGLGKRRLDYRQIIVSLAFAAAVGTMFLVTQIGLATLAGINAGLRAAGRDMLVLEEPVLGTVSPPPTLSLTDYVNLCGT